ncbi:hypothetical protein AArcSl_2663 [Halalkaliarchaeum desulfuricum]|uniref:Uncharacterized protein n=1 Tax=Halalkaliarchaeum desulfuricum TaxID=2055893 RepID=A0A343TMF9_9EURY|nr:hypothetical protein [Halalkaliarchaeum desulfuricum]AUX10281.1 hypothetical protein AArcSl_2663 [Halalkaliarchaeum desulfuricum]
MTERETRTMANVSHTNPNTGETFGTVYRRGPAVADGGEPRDATSESERKTMADIDHESPNEDVADVWERGLDVPDVPGVPDVVVESEDPRASDD